MGDAPPRPNFDDPQSNQTLRIFTVPLELIHSLQRRWGRPSNEIPRCRNAQRLWKL
jgi:hypothetical protein